MFAVSCSDFKNQYMTFTLPKVVLPCRSPLFFLPKPHAV